MSKAISMIELRIQFGSRVREIRKDQHLTQTQLGQIAGLDRSQISRIECGHGNTTLDTILLIAHGLGIAPSELFAGIDANAPAESGILPAMLTLPNERSIRYHIVELKDGSEPS